jgi:hypothetical protein
MTGSDTNIVPLSYIFRHNSLLPAIASCITVTIFPL